MARLLIVAGKGGVGKTTVTAALAELAATTGANVLVVDVEGKPGLAAAFGAAPLGYGETVLVAGDAANGRGAIAGRTITPDDALVEYLDDHGMHRLSKRLVATGALDVVATATPGIKDILVLGKVKQLVLSGRHDLVLLDTPASGHAVTFLLSPRGLLDAARSGPVRQQAEEVIGLLADGEQCQVVLVTIPEETPVTEAVETAFVLEDRVGLALGPVVVNGLLASVLEGRAGRTVTPAGVAGVAEVAKAARAARVRLSRAEAAALSGAAAFEAQRAAFQRDQLDRLAAELPLPQLRLPALDAAAIGPPEVAQLAAMLAEGLRSLDEDALR